VNGCLTTLNASHAKLNTRLQAKAFNAFNIKFIIPKPEYFLDAGSGTHAVQTAKIMTTFENVCLDENPDVVVRNYPVFGSGPGTYATIFTQYQPPGFGARSFFAHNDYLHFTAELELFLMAVVVWMIIALYKKAFEKLKSPSRLVRGTTMGAVAGITAILVHSFGDFNLNIPANAILFTVLAALAAGPVPLDNVSRIRLTPDVMEPALFSPNQSAGYQPK
jgi:hypothetical protein